MGHPIPARGGDSHLSNFVSGARMMTIKVLGSDADVWHVQILDYQVSL